MVGFRDPCEAMRRLRVVAIAVRVVGFRESVELSFKALKDDMLGRLGLQILFDIGR